MIATFLHHKIEKQNPDPSIPSKPLPNWKGPLASTHALLSWLPINTAQQFKGLSMTMKP
jgi:hypothetical protein